MSNLSAASRVYFDVREKIVSLEFQPGKSLTREELAVAYGVSQSPVREAILRLEQDGLVESFPQSKTVVTKINLDRLGEEHFLRNAIECDVVRKLTSMEENSTVLREVDGIVRMQSALAGDLDQLATFNELDVSFHRALFEGAGQSNLHAHVYNFCSHLLRARGLDMPRVEKMYSVLEDHKLIVECIKDRNPESAAKSMADHLQRTIGRIESIRCKHAEFFE